MLASIITFVLYIVVLIAIGVITYLRAKSYSDYTLAGRSNNKWVAAISAESSDMSGWLLMGLPGAAFAGGFSSIWIMIGLIFGTMINWMYVANRLRIATEVYNVYSITEYFEKRVNDKSGSVALVSGIAIIVFMIINASAEIIGSGKLLNATFGLDYSTGIVIGLVIVVLYTFLGGYMAVSWSNLFQGSIMFIALLFVPLAVLVEIGGYQPVVESLWRQNPAFFQFLNGETEFFPALSIALGGLGVGLCYFGMVHVLTCFMSIKNSSEIKDSTFIATTWVSISTFGAVLVGMIGAYLFPSIGDPEQIFFAMGKNYFPPYMLGLFAAAVVVISLLAFLMSLKSDLVFAVALLAAAGLGSSFGPLVLFCLYSRNVNKTGAISSIIVGLVTVIFWYYSGLSAYIFELIPGFIASSLALIIGTKIGGGADAETVAQYDAYLDRLNKNKRQG
ncbi:MAG: sodium/proline symporter [Cloacibacillus porcorum]|uniref:sodium/proline symporter n=1 Tax=Cloacibacillus porcorum TaxID=1197717 RepID=UPI0023F41150|nr:sodium/proline symporter [Cloacibacillus porcorum]MCD7878107.1 sodium/proline symporter [Cloacibacillus porcorum]